MDFAELRAECLALAPDAFFLPDDGEEDDFPGRMVINANDWFMWACADGQDVTPGTMPDFRRAVADAGPQWGPLLFASRQRGQRPQGAWFESIPTALHALFMATGPVQPVGFGNPCPAPDQAGYNVPATEE